jgi:nitronate monooxygenase
VVRTGFVNEWHGRESELADPAVADREMQRYSSAAQKGDPNNTGVWIGEAAGLIHDVKLAGEIVSNMVAEAKALLSRGQAFSPSPSG